MSPPFLQILVNENQATVDVEDILRRIRERFFSVCNLRMYLYLKCLDVFVFAILYFQTDLFVFANFSKRRPLDFVLVLRYKIRGLWSSAKLTLELSSLGLYALAPTKDIIPLVDTTACNRPGDIVRQATTGGGRTHRTTILRDRLQVASRAYPTVTSLIRTPSLNFVHQIFIRE